jgi:hypothetical protein
MKRLFVAGIVALWLLSAVPASAGMSWAAYTAIKSKSQPSFSDVVYLAGEPDLIRESGLGGKIFLYYWGARTTRARTEVNVTVVINSWTDKVLSIKVNQ